MSLTSYGCHYSHRNYSHGSDVYRSKTGLKRSSACAKVNPWRVISVAYQRVGQQTGKSQAYLFVPWTAMPVLSLLLILSHFPKECCEWVLHRSRAAGCLFPCPSWKWGGLLWPKACSSRARSPLPLMLVCSLESRQLFG